MKKRPKRAKLTGKSRELASEYVAEEVRTGKYPRAQAIAIGISRARSEAAAARRRTQISGIVKRYR